MFSLFRRKSSPDAVNVSSSEDRRSRSLTLERVQLRASGFACQQGRKQIQNEDRVRMLPEDGFALVLDGHSGSQCAKVAFDQLSCRIGRNMSKKWKSLSPGSPKGSSSSSSDEEEAQWEAAAKAALIKTFRELDADILRSARVTGDESAASAVCCITRFSRVILANIGCCTGLYIRHDGNVARLTLNHDVSNRLELDRLLEASTMNLEDIEARFRGIPLRSFGDIKRKLERTVTISPDTITLEMEKGSFLLLCSSGVTASMRDEDIARFVLSSIIRTRGDMSVAAAELASNTARIGGDDSSVVLLAFS